MQLIALGLNHTTAPVEVRQRVAFGDAEIPATIGYLRERFASPRQGGVHEAAILSTCNRTEIYLAAENAEAARASVLSYLAECKHVQLNELEPHIYTFYQEEAAQHTFRVASGLDSMVLGETQIVGQMKKAEKIARECHGLGVMLNHLFQTTFTVAKEVRTATAIGANSVSLAAAAVRLALIAEFDVIVSCTASALPIIGLGMIERAVAERRHRPMFIVDLAVPRDVEAEIDRLDDVYVYTVDDLGQVVNQGLQSRQAAISQAETIIRLRVNDFSSWLKIRETVPSIQSLRDRANYLRDFELQRALRHLHHGDDPEEVLEMLAYGLTNKLVHDPTILLRNGEGLSLEDRDLMERLLSKFYRRHDR